MKKEKLVEEEYFQPALEDAEESRKSYSLLQEIDFWVLTITKVK